MTEHTDDPNSKKSIFSPKNAITINETFYIGECPDGKILEPDHDTYLKYIFQHDDSESSDAILNMVETYGVSAEKLIEDIKNIGAKG